MRWGIIAALVLSCGVVLAQEPAADAPKEADPVQEKIEAATQRYYEAIEKIEKDLCRQIDAMVESYADRGELEIVIELQNQKKQFLESGYPPAAPVFASNRRRAQIEITKAINRMDRAYSDVVAQLTRQRDFTSATRMRDEWKEILATINPEIGDGFEAIRQAKKEKATLLVKRLDRFSRRVSFISWLLEQGVDLEVVEMPNATTFQLHIYAAMSQEERRVISQRTKEALVAIEKKEWSKACIAMLDYYDRCYEYELEKTNNINSIDLSGLSLELSLIKILNEKLNPL